MGRTAGQVARRLFAWAAAPALAVVGATMLRWAADPVLPPGFPFLTYFPVVIGTAFLFGWVSGAVTAAGSTAAAWWFFMPAGQPDSATIVALGFFVTVVAVDVAVIHVMQVAQDRLSREQAVSRRLADENATLLMEAQHRISNNLAVLSSLLNLQRGTIRDEAARAALLEAAAKVNTVGKIQRQLYAGLRHDASALLAELVRDTLAAAGADGVELQLAIAPVELDPEIATPLGLILLELVSNALEHAGRPEGLVVTVELRQAGGELVLRVSDNGRGPPADFDPSRARSLGMRIVVAMTQQIGATFTLSDQGGGCAEVRLPGSARTAG